MEITHKARPLDSDAAWKHLAGILGGEGLSVVCNTLHHLRILDVRSYVLEDPYIDRDYSADYAQFYVHTFHTHERYCRRVHFFSQDVSPLFQRSITTDQLKRLGDLARNSYCGFSVIRPLSTAPVGRTVLLARMGGRFNMEATVTCRADIEAHLLGIPLKVAGTSFLQQDSRVGACAQAAIWAGMRHMHARHGHNWMSVADITRFAAPPSVTEAGSLPNASDCLSSNAMVRAIAKAGYQPLCFQKPDIGRAIFPYVESGIPVVLGLDIGGTMGHAVSVIGRVFAKQQNPTHCAFDYVPAYIIHDDQSGPYMSLPVDRCASKIFSFRDDTISRFTPAGSLELNVEDHAVFAVALMPTRVFSTAARAEHYARSEIGWNLDNLATAREELASFDIPVNDGLLDGLLVAHSGGNIVLRTYLTSAAGYRRHLDQGSASDALKDRLLRLHLPHFIWITEISTIDSYNQSSPGLRRIFGHTVLDATSTAEFRDALLVLHLPGILLTKDAGNQEPPIATIIDEDRLYECREKRL